PGDRDAGTLLRAVMHKKGTLISIHGSGERQEEKGTRRKLIDPRVPAGGKTFTVESAGGAQEGNAPHPALSRSTGKTITLDSPGGLKVGDPVLVVRNTNARWVHEVGMDRIPGRPGAQERTHMWKPGPREAYDRTIAEIQPSTSSGQAKITLDIPLFNDFTADYGGGFLYRYKFPGRIAQVGVEIRPAHVHDAVAGPRAQRLPRLRRDAAAFDQRDAPSPGDRSAVRLHRAQKSDVAPERQPRLDGQRARVERRVRDDVELRREPDHLRDPADRQQLGHRLLGPARSRAVQQGDRDGGVRIVGPRGAAA